MITLRVKFKSLALFILQFFTMKGEFHYEYY
nr:MAG TPA: Spindle pole body component [Caudoviricetes sp.]